MGIFNWLRRENFVLPPEEYQIKLVKEIEEKLKTAKGSEKTKLTYIKFIPEAYKYFYDACYYAIVNFS